MTRLFILLYLGVLAVLFAAWYIHGEVSEARARADRARVFEAAHGGGARLLAREIGNVAPDDRETALERLRESFDHPLQIVPVTALSASVQRRLRRGDDVVYSDPEGQREVVVAALASGDEVVQLGPFRDYGRREIEESLGGWMRLTSESLGSCTGVEREVALANLRHEFDFPIEVMEATELPPEPRSRLNGGIDIVFYPLNPPVNDLWVSATPLADGEEVVRFGPFPSFERIEQKAATTTLALVLLPVALAIALLLRPVVRQLRHVENAAKTIAAGDLSARVNERRVSSAKPLAQAFNHMAAQTETLVRTQRELLQAVSHELRTPLARMRFAIDLIDNATDDADRKQRLESLDAATEELDELVGELLRYVRMETTGTQLNQEAFQLSDALDTLIGKFAAVYPDVAISIRDDDDLASTTVVADRVGFQRAVGNLISNAGRFANRRVTIGVEQSDSALSIDVDDDGCGIAPAERQRVFEPFVRLDEQPDGNGHGVGLGLALVQRIVTQHGGAVEVLTSPLGGCRVRTQWPRSHDSNSA